MKVINGFRGLGLGLCSPAVTIGNFDGVHRGHQRVMRSAQAEAKARRTSSVVCTFHPHTERVLRPELAPPYLQTLQQRLAAIERLSVDLVVVIPFDESVARTPHQRFVDEFLIGELAVGSLHVSKGFSFGRDHAGSTAYLELRARESGFSVSRVSPAQAGGAPVTSTRIRDAISRGRIPEATDLLGRPHIIIGEVVRGSGRGRALHTPTANLRIESECVPARGVYATLVAVDGGLHPSVTNIGTRPTFNEGSEIVVETHLLNWDGDLCGTTLELSFIERLRAEKRFESADALQAQMRSDIERARGLLPGPIAVRPSPSE